jgi:hypothetical protein
VSEVGAGMPESPRDGRARAAIGARLRDAGLTARGLAAWAGTARTAALPARIAEISARPPTPAGAILGLFVGGAEIACDRLRALPALPALIDELIAHQLVERNGDRLRARVANVPLGPALLVCDRLDAPVERALVCWPDDSSHHLATAIPQLHRPSRPPCGYLRASQRDQQRFVARSELARGTRAGPLTERPLQTLLDEALLRSVDQLLSTYLRACLACFGDVITSTW